MTRWITLLGALALTGCLNSPPPLINPASNSGKLQILLHDAPLPGPIEKVNVTITSVEIVDEEGQITLVSDNVFDFDLLTLTPDRPLMIFDQDIASGRYCQIRLHFAQNNNVVVAGVQKPLLTPSAMEWQSGFKINGCFEIQTGKNVTLTLDFIPENSLVYNPGKDRYVLKPVINLIGAGEQIINTYNMQASYLGQAYVAQFNTAGAIRFLKSSDMRYVYNGTYTYDPVTNLIHVTYKEVIEINPACLSCGIVDIHPVAGFYIDPVWVDFELLDYTENTIAMKIISTGETMNFSSRIAFGPFDEMP